jgi:hypothetical protein
MLLLSLLSVIVISCSRKNTEEPITTAPDFTRLQIGNYWVYEFYKVDTNNAAIKIAGLDSSYIPGDTLIGGVQYFIYISSGWPFIQAGLKLAPNESRLLRDSLGYLLSPYYGRPDIILFARDNFTDILYSDTVNALFNSQCRMTGKDSVVTVPAGSFNTRTNCCTYFPKNPDYPWGIRKNYDIYGKNTGKIKSTIFFASQPDHYEARLVRYHVK